MPRILMVRTHFSYADPTPPVFQDPAMKLKNQTQAKLRDLLKVTSTIQISLSPSSRVTGLSHQSPRIVRVVGVKSGFPTCGAACYNGDIQAINAGSPNVHTNFHTVQTMAGGQWLIYIIQPWTMPNANYLDLSRLALKYCLNICLFFCFF